jgi:hypothetical protein
MLQLSAHEVGGAQVTESLVGKRHRRQFGPETVLNPAWIDTGMCECRITRCQFVVTQPRESGLTIDNALSVRKCYSGVI